MLCGGNTVIMCGMCDMRRKSFFRRTHFFLYLHPPRGGGSPPKNIPLCIKIPPPPGLSIPWAAFLFSATRLSSYEQPQTPPPQNNHQNPPPPLPDTQHYARHWDDVGQDFFGSFSTQH